MNRLARTIAALGLVGSTSIAGVMLLPASPAAAQAPDSTAWWNSANLGDPVPAPPAPPDVKSGDLYVEGSNAGPLSSILGNSPPTTQAISAVAFDLPKGAAVGTLTLQIDGTTPPQVSVTACKTTESFTSTENGPWSEVPSYDANECVPGALKGTSVQFTDVSKLAKPSSLSVVILPGPLDRVVFKAPGAGTLTVESGGNLGTSAPPVGTGSGSSSSSGGGSASAPKSGPAVGGGSSSGGSSGGVLPSVGNLPGTSTTTTPGSVAPPVVASPNTTPTAAQPATATGGGMSTKERRLIALLIIAAEVVGYVLLRRWPAREAAPVAAAVTAGGRLRPPDRPVSDARTGDAGGVGRFRRERRGPVPHL
jgi:hypothetical protein